MQEIDIFITKYKHHIDSNDMEYIRSYRDEFHSLKKTIKQKITYSFS